MKIKSSNEQLNDKTFYLLKLPKTFGIFFSLLAAREIQLIIFRICVMNIFLSVYLHFTPLILSHVAPVPHGIAKA